MIARFAISAVVVAGLALIVPDLASDLIGASLGRSSGEPVKARQPAPAASQPTLLRSSRPKTSRRRVVVEAGRGGHFLVEANVGGRPLDLMVDTGASTVALTAATARRLGINPRTSDFVVPISTANGIIHAAQVRLTALRIGRITVRDVAAVVVPGEALTVNLLGMSFLGQLSNFEISGERLVLVQ